MSVHMDRFVDVNRACSAVYFHVLQSFTPFQSATTLVVLPLLVAPLTRSFGLSIRLGNFVSRMHISIPLGHQEVIPIPVSIIFSFLSSFRIRFD